MSTTAVAMTTHDFPNAPRAPTAAALDGVAVAATALSHVDGARGELVLVGHRVEELAPRATFESALDAFWGPGAAQHLGAARVDAFHGVAELMPLVRRAVGAGGSVMGALAAALAAAVAESGADAEDAATTRARGLRALALLQTTTAACARVAQGLRPLPPDAALSHAADLLRMARTDDAPITAAEVRALDTYWVTVMDHGMNASTFAARVAASTGTCLPAALLAGLCTLKGPLHGGAPGPVLDLIDAIATPQRARAYLTAELDAGRRIMGMGHRIYRVRDPRAAVLEQALHLLVDARAQAGSGHDPHVERLRERAALALVVEREATAILAERHPTRPLKANVEFFTAALLDAIGLDRRIFSALFACARAVGWTAHVVEQRAVGRLIRPASEYVGAWPEAAR